ncbi:glycosyltransferase family 4 protein [Hyphobacterium sp. CCMP332]|nr:glycosyltransferase family 4 protein [Hyphobacterium sp. CCMP332]
MKYKLTIIFDQFAHPNQPFWHQLYLRLIQLAGFEIKIFTKKKHCTPIGQLFLLRQKSGIRRFLNLPFYFISGLKNKIDLKNYLNFPDLAEDQNSVVHILNSQQYPAISLFLKDKKKIFSFRGYETLVRPAKDPEWKAELQNIYGEAKLLHFVSDYIKTKAIEGFNAPEDKCKVIRRSVDIEFFNPGKRNYALSPVIRICTIGRLTWQKDYLTALKAIRDLKDNGNDIEYFIAGEGEMENEIRSQIATFDLDSRVNFMGNLNRKSVKELLAYSDIYIQSSVNEALPNSILEASAMAMPIVSTNVGGIPEAIIHEKTGLLVDKKDYENMAKCIQNLIEDKNLRIEIGKGARKLMIEKFHPDLELKYWVDTYKELIEN